MRNKEYCVAAGILGVLIAVSGVLLAQSKPQESPIQIRKSREQVVLYTIHRGPFDTIGATIGELMGTAAPKGLYRPTEGPREVFLTNASAGDYSKMKSEIMVPVRKMSAVE